MAPKLGYYAIRALADPIRLMLHHADVEFEDFHYYINPPPNYNRDAWFSVKYTLGLQFPNVPYYMDGDLKITQAAAIMRYLGRKHDMIAKTEEEHLRSDQAEQVGMETMWQCLIPWYTNKDHEKSINENIPPKIEQISKFLGDRQFLLGDRVTYVDFLWYSVLDYIRLYKSSLLDGTPNLIAFMDRIESLPRIATYLNSDKFYRKPICGSIAFWGGSKE